MNSNIAKWRQYKIGWLIDGTGGPASENAVIEVRNGIIETVAINPDKPDFIGKPENNDREPETVDLSEYTVIPALMDCHVHLFMSGTADMEIRRRQLEAGYGEIEPVIAGHVEDHLASGVVAVRDGADRSGHAMRYRDSNPNMRNTPLRIKVAGRAWNRPGRYGKLIGRSPEKGQTLAEAIGNDLEKLAPRRPDHVKIVNSGINSLKHFGRQTPPQFDPREMKEAVKVSGANGLPTMVHANGVEPVKIAVEAGCRSIEHGFFIGEDNLRRMSDRGTFWVPTACTMKGYAETLDPRSPEAEAALKYLDHQVEQMALGRELGVDMAVGTDAGSMGANHGVAVLEELKLFVRAGFRIEEAISCATGKAARLMDIKTLGELRPGKEAAFIAVKGRPENLLANLPNSRLYPELPPMARQRRNPGSVIVGVDRRGGGRYFNPDTQQGAIAV